MFTYAAHGLTIASPFFCPELAPSSGDPDVFTHVGTIPQESTRDYDVSPRHLLLSMAGVGRFCVRDGREIFLEPAAGVGLEAIRPFFLGSCLGIVLHQRGVLALHASGACTADGAVLITGESGAGKSTLTAALLRRGCSLIADDVCAIDADAQGWPTVLPGLRQLKLSDAAAARVGIDRSQARPIAAAPDKMAIAAADAMAATPAPLRAIYVLEPSVEATPSFQSIDGAERIWALTVNTYRPWYLDGLERRADNFRLVTMAARAPVVRVMRPTNLDALDDLAAALLAHAAAAVR